MRNIREWRRNLAKDLRRNWPSEAPEMDIGMLCDVELGLFLLERVAPHENAEALPAFLWGTPFGWQPTNTREIAVARHLLVDFRSPTVWKRALENYADCPDNLRGFALNALTRWRQKPVSVASDRFAIYLRSLQTPVAHRANKVAWAGAGDYRFKLDGLSQGVTIPDSLCFDPPNPHDFAARTANAPMSTSLEELKQTARWMDETETEKGLPRGEDAGHWLARLERVELLWRGADGASFEHSERIDIAGLLHLVGMVSSGKSTLMEVLAVHFARRGRHVTLVLADVIDVLRRASLFERLGIRAAPILGATTRESHLNRLHRVVAAQQPDAGIDARHPAFRWLSTQCALDGLRQDASDVIPLDARPCAQLSPAESDGDEKRSCPIYAKCDFHRASLDARTAKIWLATAASLVTTRVAPQLSEARVRWAEMIYRRSDLVIIDEADRVQIQLDLMFSPSETLISRGDKAWMPRLEKRVTERIHGHRGVLSEGEVSGWNQSHTTLQGVANLLYHRLMTEPDVRGWLTQRRYFTAHLLWSQIADKCSGAGKTSEGDATVKEALRAEFDVCMDAPMEGESALCQLAQRLNSSNGIPASKASDWLQNQLPEQLQLSPDDARKWGKRLEAALLVTMLQNRLAYVLKMWRSVEEPLRLDDGGNLLFQRPPDDFKPVLPLPPMGRELAFQYLPPDDKANGAGDLRFFRCEAVGRALMLNFHKLWADEGVAGPHVLLLSGTSWAGASPSCHVQARVDGILKAPDREIEAIELSVFRFNKLRYPAHSERAGEPIRVSGTRDNDRANALCAALYQLAVGAEPELPSALERERDALPANRQRVLLLVGSYEEARIAYDWFTKSAPNASVWKDNVRALVPDNSEGETEVDEGQLPRGLVGQFGKGEPWVLIAPLLAIERGHNIIDEVGNAAIGAAYFLVRPHPRPDDIGYAIHSINRWALDASNVEDHGSINVSARDFRRRGRSRWNALVQHRLQWSKLKPDEREAVTWTMLVAIWQVIGRLVRGGKPARVFFCDAAFAPQSARGKCDDQTSSLLVAMRQVLQPYFDTEFESDDESELVQRLYGPFYEALKNTYELAEGSEFDAEERAQIEREDDESDEE